VLRLETDNQAPNSEFRQTAGALSAGALLRPCLDARLVLRIEDSTAGNPGQTAFGRPDLDSHLDRTDLVGAGRLRYAAGSALHELRFGIARSDQLSLNPVDSGSYLPRAGDRLGAFPISDFPNPAGFSNDSTRASLGYQVERQAGARNLVT